jgi:hypothetical protein
VTRYATMQMMSANGDQTAFGFAGSGFVGSVDPSLTHRTGSVAPVQGAQPPPPPLAYHTNHNSMMMNGYSYHGPSAANYSFAHAAAVSQPSGSHLTQLGTGSVKHSSLALNPPASLSQPLQQPFHQQFAQHSHFAPLDESGLGAAGNGPLAAAAAANHNHIPFTQMDYFSKSAMINQLSVDSFIAAGTVNGKLHKSLDSKGTPQFVNYY